MPTPFQLGIYMSARNSNSNVQVGENYYKQKKYNSLERFISYAYQIDAVTSLGEIHSILEIGPGSKLVARELIERGYVVTTADFDPRVDADITADVRSLPCSESSFDCIMACQVLEHIPYNDFERVIGDLARITKQYVVMSLPERHTGIEMIFKIPFIQTFFKRKFFDWWLKIPVRFPGFKESDQHYWEIDGFTTTRGKVRRSLERYFSIKREFNPPLNKYHHFYVLEKK